LTQGGIALRLYSRERSISNTMCHIKPLKCTCHITFKSVQPFVTHDRQTTPRRLCRHRRNRSSCKNNFA